MSVTTSLTKAQVRRAARLLRAKGRKLPKIGWCSDLQGRPRASPSAGAVRICHDARGYYIFGQWDTPERRAAFNGRRRSRR